MSEQSYWQRALGRGTTRRGVIRGGAIGAAGLVGAALVGCGGDSSATPAPSKAAGGATTAATAAAQAKRGGQYRVGFTGPFAGVDPHSSVYGGSGVVPQVYSYLIRKEVLRPEGGTIQELASSHAVQADKLTWVFKLRPDAKIAPNKYSVPERPIDSEDVLKSFDRIKDPKNGANGAILLNRWVDKYDAPDPQTVRVITKQPFAWVEECLGDNLQGAIVPREWLSSDKIKADAVGSGPFMLKELTEGQRAVLVPNPNYYEKGKPYVDQLSILAFQDQATFRTAFTTRQVDRYDALDIEESRQLEQSVKTVNRYEDLSTAYKSFWMRVDAAPWTDGRVRRAMNLSMDRNQYIQIIGKGQGTPIGPVTDAFKDYSFSKDELAKVQPFDAAEAKKLFDAAGIKEIPFAHPTSSNTNDFVTIMVQQLQKIGITAKPDPQDAGTWVAGYFGGKLTASLSLNQQYKTPDAALQWYHTGGITGNNRYDTKFSVPAIDAALDKAATTLEVEARKAAYLDAQRLILKSDPPFINFYDQFGNPLVYKDIQGFTHGPGNSIDYYNWRNFWVNA